MSLYSPDIVYFDVVPPLRFTGSAAVRGNFMRWFDEYEGPIGLETQDLSIAMSGDVAFAHMLHLDKGNTRHGRREFWLRSTVCCQQSASQWWITHEHISLPVDFRSGTVLMDLVP
jgi:ketosteroid isomerase-like protein